MPNRWKNSLYPLQRLAPLRCRLCQQPSDTAITLCTICRGQLLENAHGCPRCGLPAPSGIARAGTICPTCLTSPTVIDRTLAPFIYEEGIAFLINRWKYHGELQLGLCLARLWCDAMEDLPAIDGLLPVPLHWSRFLHRGFNQSADLARMIARHREMPPPLRSVRRSQRTAPQARASRRHRLQNLGNTFALRRDVRGLRLAIVDDVCTTGATANAIATLLKQGGAAEVQLWCLARTPVPGQD